MTQISPAPGATDIQRRHYDTTVPGQYRPPLPSYAAPAVRPPRQVRFQKLREAARVAFIVLATVVVPVAGSVAFVAAVEYKNRPRGDTQPVLLPAPAPVSAAPAASVSVAPPVTSEPVASARSYLPGYSPAPRASVDPTTGFQAPVAPGTYHVGDDLTPGVYTTQGPESSADTCHYRRSNDPAGNRRIVSDDRATGPVTLNLYAGEYLMTRGCKRWVWKSPPSP